jgi:rhamnogalacturonan endolyase
MWKSPIRSSLPVIAGLLLSSAAWAQTPQRPPRQMEQLGRGVAAVKQEDGKAFISWRLLGTDPDNIGFNVYRQTAGGEMVKRNPQPITNATSFQDSDVDASKENAWFVAPVIDGKEQEKSKPFLNKIAANAPTTGYFSIPLKTPPGGTTPDNANYTYTPNDASVGDVDGDGEYEIFLKWDPSNAHDNSQAGYTGNVYIDCYKIDGTQLWRIDMGKNIRAGAHYTQFSVYDFDGDGKAEMICRTADGTVDGTGKTIGDAKADYRNDKGYILEGPEFLTVFEGATGKALASEPFQPARGNLADWGDTYGNRVDRFLSGVAYVDGQRPSAIVARGYYTGSGNKARNEIVAYNWRDGKLSTVWYFKARGKGSGDINPEYTGQGNHNLSVADVDGDGKDEIIYGAMCIDDNGKGLYSTGLGHGDALHVSDMDPNRPGLEVFDIHENPRHPNGLEFRDARTGKLIWGKPGVEMEKYPDVGRGVAFDIDPRYPGYEMWGSFPGLYDVKGKQISENHPNSMNFGVWWDGDYLRELLDRNHISKWDYKAGKEVRLLTARDADSNNGTKATPALSGDLFGDWREEVMLRSNDNELRIYTTTIPTEHRLYTLMHDCQYREAIAWQNTAYNQPPHPSFFLGDGMKAPPKPNIRLAGKP